MAKVKKQNERLAYAQENMPEKLPQATESIVLQEVAAVEPKATKKPQPKLVKPAKKQKAGKKKTKEIPTIAYVRVDEFQQIPKYMRGRSVLTS